KIRIDQFRSYHRSECKHNRQLQWHIAFLHCGFVGAGRHFLSAVQSNHIGSERERELHGDVVEGGGIGRGGGEPEQYGQFGSNNTGIRHGSSGLHNGIVRDSHGCRGRAPGPFVVPYSTLFRSAFLHCGFVGAGRHFLSAVQSNHIGSERERELHGDVVEGGGIGRGGGEPEQYGAFGLNNTGIRHGSSECHNGIVRDQHGGREREPERFGDGVLSRRASERQHQPVGGAGRHFLSSVQSNHIGS